MTALELGVAIQKQSIDPVDLAEYFLDRMAAKDPGHRIYIRATAGPSSGGGARGIDPR